MLTEEQRFQIRDYFARDIQGGSAQDFMSICDLMIENEVITQDLFDQEELEIAGIFGDDFFNCAGCSWTYPLDEQSAKDFDEMVCRNCEDDY